MSARKRQASFCPWFRNRYLNGFNTSICFIRRLDFQKTYGYYFSAIEDVLNTPRFLLPQGGFVQADIFSSSRKLPQAKSFPSSRKFSTSKDFSFTKEVFRKQRLFLYQGHFLPPTRNFHSSRNFSSSKYFPFIKEAFHKPRFFLHQGSFWQGKIFSSSKKFTRSKYFPQAKIFPWSRKFSTSKDYFMIMEVFRRQNLFF